MKDMINPFLQLLLGPFVLTKIIVFGIVQPVIIIDNWELTVDHIRPTTGNEI